MKPAELERELKAKLSEGRTKSKDEIDELCAEYLQRMLQINGSHLVIEAVKDEAYAAIGAKRTERNGRLRATPPIGYMVQWLLGGIDAPGKVFAAVVTGVVGPGEISLQVFGKEARAVNVCRHVTNDLFKNPHNQVARREGAWRYLPGDEPNEAHYATEQEREAVRLANAKRQEDNKKALARLAAQEKKIAESEDVPI